MRSEGVVLFLVIVTTLLFILILTYFCIDGYVESIQEQLKLLGLIS